MSKLTLIFSLFLSFLLPIFSFAGRDLTSTETSQISSLLESFSPGCSLISPSTQDAIALVKGLTQTLQAAKDSQCESVSGIVSKMQQAQLRAEGWMPWVNETNNNSVDIEISGLLKQKEQALFLLTQTNSSEEIEDLKSEIRSLELQIARLKGEGDAIYFNEKKQRESRALLELVSAANAAMNQILANESCWINRPNLLREVGSVAIGIGGAATIASPVSKSAVVLGAATSLITSVFSFFDRLKIEKKISQFEMTLNPTALTCVLERMSEIYCSARDNIRTIELAAKEVHGDDPIWKGIKVLESDLPIAMGWLDRLRSGGIPTDISDAQTRHRLRLAESELRESPTLAMAIISEREKLFDAMATEELKFQVLKSAALEVANNFCPNYDNMGSVSYSNPICDFYAPDFNPFYLIGLTADDREAIGSLFNGRIFKLSEIELSYIRKANIPFQSSFTTLENRFVDWHRQATDKFLTKLRLSNGGDLDLIFASAEATNSFDRSTKFSPLDSLKKIKAFIVDPKYANSNPTNIETQIFNKTVLALEVAIQQVELVNAGKPDSNGNIMTPDLARDQILSHFKLSETTNDLREAILHLFKVRLDRAVVEDDSIPNDLLIQWLAASDYIAELKKYYGDGRVSLEQLATQAEETQNIVTRSVPNLFSSFAEPLQTAISQTKGRPKALYCFHLLMSPGYNTHFAMEGCKGVQGVSLTPNGVNTPVFSSDLFKVPFEQRTCIYRDFLRKNLLIQYKGRSKKVSALGQEFGSQRDQKIMQSLIKKRIQQL